MNEYLQKFIDNLEELRIDMIFDYERDEGIWATESEAHYLLSISQLESSITSLKLSLIVHNRGKV
jgi:hypothetical protein